MDCLIIVDYLRLSAAMLSLCSYGLPDLIIVDYLRLSAAMLSLCSYGLPDHRGLS